MVLKENIQVAKLETVKEFGAELAFTCAQIVEVDAKANRALNETPVLHDRMALAEEASRSDRLRMAQLESGLRNLEARLATGWKKFERDKFDPALQRIRFAGWPANTPSSSKRAAIEAFLQQHCPDTKPIHVREFGEKASFAHFGTPGEMKAALNKTKDKHTSNFVNVKPKCQSTKKIRNELK